MLRKSNIMRILNILNKIIILLFNGILYLISKLVPKDSKLIVIGSSQGMRFDSNSMYFYFYLLENSSKYDIKFTWCTKSRDIFNDLNEKGYPVVYLYTLEGFFSTIRAKYSVISHRLSDIQEGLIGGSTIVQLWHGTPFRKIGYEGDWKGVGISGAIKKIIYTMFPYAYYMKCDWLVAGCEHSAVAFSEAFKYGLRKRGKILRIGQPRNDYYLLKNKSLECHLNDDKKYLHHLKSKFNKLYCWLPTHRFFQGKQFSNLSVGIDSDFYKLNKILRSKNICLVIKSHPLEIGNFNLPDGLSNIFIYERELVEPLIKSSDVVISDYSSVIFDAMLNNKGVLLFCPDLDDYLKKPGIYFSCYEDFEKKITRSFAEFICRIESGIYSIDCPIIYRPYVQNASESILAYMLQKKLTN